MPDFTFEDMPESFRQPELAERQPPAPPPPPRKKREEKPVERVPVVRKQEEPKKEEPRKEKMRLLDPWGHAGSESLNGFYSNVGTNEFNEALTWAGNAETVADPKWLQLQYLMAHPKTRHTKFSTLCKRLEIQLIDLVEMWRTWKVNAGTARMMDHIPDIMEDIARDSRTRYETCPDCEDGIITTEETEETEDKIIIREKERICGRCYGRGKIQISGDRHARELLFETAGLTNKKEKKGPMVAIQQNFGSGELPETTKKVSKILDNE